MKEIPLENSTKVALIDDFHHAWLMQYTWCLQKSRANRTSYAYRVERTPDGRKTRVLMHRQILGLEYGDPRETDHRDCNGLHNLESNLRIVTPLQNAANRPLQLRSRTGHKGVKPRPNGKYLATIYLNGMHTHLGIYSDILEASFCYNTAAAHLHGDHAGLNPIPPDRIPLARQAELRQHVLDKLAQQSGKQLNPRSPRVVYWDATRARWRVRVALAGRWVHVGCYPDKAEADYAAALALDPNTVLDPAIKPARLEFIRKRVAHLQSVHQPEPEPAGT
jgi:hypothetical protein